MRMDIDSGGYTSATDDFYAANHAAIECLDKLIGVLDDSGAMAGSDSGGEAWAGQYDAASGPLVRAGCDLGRSMAQMANLLNASLRNHEGADYASRVYGPPVGTAADDDPDPDHWTESLLPADPPSAFGGTGDQPGWWHWIAGHVGGLLWPDADTGRLRATGDAWKAAGEQLGAVTARVDAASATIGLQRSPEVDDAVATCGDLSRHVGDVATAFGSIGQACIDYADQVDQHHQEIEDELASFIEWTVGIEVGGAIVGFFTAGIGEAGAQALEASKVAEAAAKVIAILQRLIEAARLVASRIGALLAKVADVSAGLRGLLGARTVKALEETGETLAKEATYLGKGPGFTAEGALDPAAFTTEKDTAFFWSGRTGSVGGPEVAGRYAEEGGGTTLEQLMERRGIKLPEWDPDNPAVVDVWTRASESYAQQVSGEVRAVIGENVRPGAVWHTELEALEHNPAVTRITTIDPATGKATVIYP